MPRQKLFLPTCPAFRQTSEDYSSPLGNLIDELFHSARSVIDLSRYRGPKWRGWTPNLCGRGPSYLALAGKDENPLDVTFNQMTGAIGSLIRLWSRIERSARDDVARLLGDPPAGAHGIKAAIRTWESAVVKAQPTDTLCALLAATLRSQLQEQLDIRNGICHGLIGIMGSVGYATAELSWELNGLKRSISWEELQSSLQWLSTIRLVFSAISNPALDRLDCRVIDTIENREWWRAEFGLDLPQ